MELKRVKPNTSGSRNYVKINNGDLSKRPLLKNCIHGKKK